MFHSRSIPYSFDHYNCNYAGFSVDGHPLPARPFQPNFKDKLYVEPYFCLFNKQNKVDDEPFSDYISRNDYPHGYCIYVFDLRHQMIAPNFQCLEKV